MCPGVAEIWFGMEVSGSTLQAQSELNPALNRYLKKSGEGKQEGCTKAQYV